MGKKKPKIISSKNSFEGFDLEEFIVSFKRPFIILIVFVVGLIANVPELAPLIALLGGASVIAERLWAIVKFYTTEYIE